MTRAQHVRYRKTLWPAACRAQKWSEADETMRRDVTLQATEQSTTAGLSNDQVTALFRLLDFLADPLSVAKGIPAACPDVAKEENRRRQLFWVIGQQGFADDYVARCAEGFCNAEGKHPWRKLSVDSLEKLSWTLKTRARERDAEAGKRKDFIPRVTPYHQREKTKAKRRAAREPHVVLRPGVAEQIECPF